MRVCVRSCSRRQRRPQHPLEPSAGPASAGPASACPAAAAASVPGTVSPTRLPLRGPVNLCGRLLLLFVPLSHLLLLLPLLSRTRKPPTRLTLAPLQTVSTAQLYLAPPAPLRQRAHRLVFYFLQSCIVLHPLPQPALSASRVSCRPAAPSRSCAPGPLLGSDLPPLHLPRPAPAARGI